MEPASRLQWSYRTILTILGLVIVGGALVALSLAMGPGRASSFVDKIATILIVSAVWSGVYQMQLRKDFIRILDDSNDSVLRQVGLTKDLDTAGLDRVYADAGSLVYDDEIVSAKTLTVLLTIGRTWVSTRSTALQARFADAEKDTLFLLLDPTSPQVAAVARRNHTTPDAVNGKIGEAVQILRSLTTTRTRLRILGYEAVAPYTGLLTDDHAYVVPYYAALARHSQPAFRFRRRERVGSFDVFRDDLAQLAQGARPIG